MKEFIDSVSLWSFIIPGAIPAFASTLPWPIVAGKSDSFMSRSMIFGAMFWALLGFLVLFSNALVGLGILLSFMFISIRLDLLHFYAELISCAADAASSKRK